MARRSCSLTGRPTDLELLEAQQFFGLPSVQLVDKDWHVIRAMQAISQVDTGPFRLVFAGGTCLARAHKLVQRMSEDVDFKVVLDDEAPASANKLRKELGALRDRITAILQASDFAIDPANTAQVRSRDANRYTVYNLTSGPTATAATPLRPTLQIELNYARLRLPSVELPVGTFVSEAFTRPPEIASIACASVTETAAEKLVSLTRRTAMELAGVSRAPDPTLVRHIYDLHRVRDHIDRAMVIDLVREISAQDAAEFGQQHPAYRADITGETRKALTFLQGDQVVAARYKDFVAAMVYGDPGTFTEAIETVATLVDEAWE